MAFTEFYCQTTGSNLNGGSDANDAAAYTATNGGWNSGTGVFTPTSGDPSASGVSVGMFASVYIDGATVGVFVGRVTAVSSTTITVSTSAKSGTAPTTNATARTIKVGGAWQGPNGTSGFPFAFIASGMTNASGHVLRVNFKSGTNYSITAGITHTINGPWVIQGYTTTPGDGGQAVIDGGTSGASYVLLTISGGARNLLADLIFRNNGATGSAVGLSYNNLRSAISRIVVNNVRGTGIDLGGSADNVVLHECEAYACNASNTASMGGFAIAPISNTHLIRCVSHDNAGSNSAGFYIADLTAGLLNCIADTNGGDGFKLAGTNVCGYVTGCTAYNNTGQGINLSGSQMGGVIQNCVLVSNGAYGINYTGSNIGQVLLFNNAFYSNTSGQTLGFNASLVSGSITLTGDPFTAAATGNFTLDNTASEGAACRGTGRGTFTETQASYTGSVGYPDVGACQHQDSGGGSGGGGYYGG